MLEEATNQEAAADMDSEEIKGQEEVHSSQVAALQEQMVSAMQRVSAAEKEAAAAKEAAGTELALMRRQLTSSQAALAEAEQVQLQPWQELVGLCPLMHRSMLNRLPRSITRSLVIHWYGPSLQTKSLCRHT